MKKLIVGLYVFLVFVSNSQAQQLIEDFPTFNGEITASVKYGNSLIVAGDFTEIDGVPIANFAKITFPDFKAIAIPIVFDSLNMISDLDINGDFLLVSGLFFGVNGEERNSTFIYNLESQEVTPFNPDIKFNGIPNQQFGSISTGRFAGDKVILGGYFYEVDGVKHNNIAKFDMQGNWENWKPTVDLPVNQILVKGDSVYISGAFREVNGASRTAFAGISNSNTLIPFAPTIDNPGNPAYMLSHGKEMFIYSGFGQVNNETRNYLAKVDPITNEVNGFDLGFSNLGSNGRNQILSLAIDGDNLYVGGEFKSDQGTGRTKDYLMSVNSVSGNDVGFDGRLDGRVSFITTYDDVLIISGQFAEVLGSPKPKVAALRLDRTTGLFSRNVESLKLQAFPNPTTGKLKFSVSLEGSYLYELFDFSGRSMKNGLMESENLNIGDVPSGIYQLRISNSQNQYSTTVIKN
jgi:hypothetical protein